MIRMLPQPFDSDILGGPVYRAFIGEETDTAKLADAIPGDALLVSARVPLPWAAAMAQAGFREMEHLVSFSRPLSAADGGAWPAGIRPAGAHDADACAHIARTSFTADRYHTDPKVDDALADILKDAWARNDITGRADAAFVAEEGGRIVGFAACIVRDEVATVDLIAVADEAQGRGIGRRLIEACFAHYAGRLPTMTIATQTTNVPAVALYTKLGFRETGREATFHWTRRAIRRESRD